MRPGLMSLILPAGAWGLGCGTTSWQGVRWGKARMALCSSKSPWQDTLALVGTWALRWENKGV